MAKQYWKVNIEITNICNLQCSFCPEVLRTKKLIEPALFAKTLEQVAPFTKEVTLHLMGDPLVHPKLGELVDLCESFGLKIFLVTNGVLLNDKEIEILLRPTFRQVNFSLHSFADNFGDKDPGPYLEKIFKFTEMAFERRPELFINYRLWNLSDPRGKESNNQQIFERIEKRFGVTIPEVDIRVKKNSVIKDRLSLHFDTEFIWPSLSLPFRSTEGTCQGLTSHFGVLVDGTVVPCCLDKEGVIALGNLHEKPLAEILGSARAQKMLKGFRTGALVEEMCQKCQYVERFDKSSLRSAAGAVATP